MRMGLNLIAAALAAVICLPAFGAGPAIDQDGWVGLKQTAHLPNGIDLKFVELGNPADPPLILLHGYTDNSRSWSLPMPDLADRFHVFALDQRGHGQSSAPECCYGLVDMAYDLKLFMDAERLARADIVGHSLGSIVTQVFAETWPDRVGKVVLVSSTDSVSGVNTRSGWLWQNVTALTAPIDPASQFMKDWYTNPNPVDPIFLAHEMRESAAVPLPVWNGVLRSLAYDEFGRGLPDLKAPVLILWGSADGFFDAAAQDRLKAALPKARFMAFAGAGHNIMWEQPKAVADAIADFLLN